MADYKRRKGQTGISDLGKKALENITELLIFMVSLFS